MSGAGRTTALPCIVMGCVLDVRWIPARIQKYKSVHAGLIEALREASTSSARTVLMDRTQIRISRCDGRVRADRRPAQPVL